jgi:hypothetical protein
MESISLSKSLWRLLMGGIESGIVSLLGEIIKIIRQEFCYINFGILNLLSFNRLDFLCWIIFEF